VEEGDEVLVKSFLAGEETSFNKLLRRWEKPVYNFVLRLLGDPEEARDACQEIFLKVYQNLARFKMKAKFSSWLYRIAANQSMSHLRKRKKKRFISLETAEGKGLKQSEKKGGNSLLPPEEEIQRKQVVGLVKKAVSALPPEQKLVILLKEYRGLKFYEIAEIVGCPLSTVKSRLYLGLSNLAGIISRLEGDKNSLLT
jgi:RNA polymerase sigma-70 factor (ECF subfamily)